MSGYRLTIPRKAEVTSTGRFVIFRLRPPKGSPHRAFWARWDNAVLKGKPGPAVKIELDHRSRRECLAFKHSLNGYAGHWPLADPNMERFDIAIMDRGTPVFRGTLSMSVAWAVDFSLVDPQAVFQMCTEDGVVIAEAPVAAFGPGLEKAARLAKRMMRKGRSKRAAWRAALIATTGLGPPPSATKIYRPDLLPTCPTHASGASGDLTPDHPAPAYAISNLLTGVSVAAN